MGAFDYLLELAAILVFICIFWSSLHQRFAHDKNYAKNMNLTLLIRYICNPFIPVATISIYIPNILYFAFIFPHCQSTLIDDGHVFYMKFYIACYWNVSIRSRRACLSICHLCNQTKFPYSIW